ncbi:hypothetical protein DXG03_000481 [Asterophora parasitica]|uniref:Thiamine diphosphokinase n=1 Tax=Asterophora parasitica TaxID=117018 RepID=A0A9P7GHH6_9AGAR|nr:hypothetical protein DXG03_000481 [Asterophora parasitica]
MSTPDISTPDIKPSSSAGGSTLKSQIIESTLIHAVSTSARVVLPERDPEPEPVDGESDEEPVEEASIEEHDEGDFLEDFPDETEDLELVHVRIGSLTNLRLARFASHLKRLCLRQNFVSFLDPEVFHPLTNLEELDFYDNRLKSIGDALDHAEKLSVLDLSFNLLKAVPEGLVHLKALDTVYFVQNRISKIKHLESCINLRSLELGGNRIRKIENIETLVNLEELWLGKNKITKLEVRTPSCLLARFMREAHQHEIIQNLGTLKKLKILSLQSNRITKLENLEELENLEQLYLSHNGVERLEGLEHNTKLTTLDVGSNFVPAIENISHLTSLEELWINGNQIPDLTALERELSAIKTMETLYLEANPCQAKDATGYRRKIMLALPQLKQIDATPLFDRVWNASDWRSCADGGANRLYDTFSETPESRSAFLPDLVKGDFDSIRDDVRAYYAQQGSTIIQDKDENSTDLMKCLFELEKRERAEGTEQYDLIILGGLAGRLDQTIHTLSYLHKLRKSRERVFAVTDDNVGWVLDTGAHEIEIDHDLLGQTCGLLPVGIDSTILKTSGLQWNLDKDPSSFDGMVSTSNHLVPEEPVVRIETSKPIWWTAELRSSGLVE